VGDNVYKIELSSEMNISNTFSVGDVTPYIHNEDEGHEYLREILLKGGG